MEKQHNPNDPGKSGNPGRESGGQHGGQQERERQEREREQREREKQGGGSSRSGER